MTNSNQNKKITDEEQERARDAFSAMPYKYRKIACDNSIHDHILHLRQSRSATVTAHKRHLRDIDDHIRNLERSVRDNNRVSKANESQEFLPCGEGVNLCGCKSSDECGYEYDPEQQEVVPKAKTNA